MPNTYLVRAHVDFHMFISIYYQSIKTRFRVKSVSLLTVRVEFIARRVRKTFTPRAQSDIIFFLYKTRTNQIVSKEMCGF